jgi:hypothetical protein
MRLTFLLPVIVKKLLNKNWTVEKKHGIYPLKKIVDILQESLVKNNTTMKIEIMENGTIQLNDDKIFNLKYYDDSILKTLGFDEQEYLNKNIYTSKI